MSRALGCTDLLVGPRYDGPLPEGGCYVRHSRTSHVSVYSSPGVEAEADGPTVVYISPTQPEGVDRGNWIQFNPEKGWSIWLRMYSPLQPLFENVEGPARSSR